MARKKPLGVILLGIYLLLYALLALSMAQGYMARGDFSRAFKGIEPMLWGLGYYAIGIIYLFIAATRFIAAVGVLTLKRRAWKAAVVLILIGMLVDLLQGHGIPLLLGVIALVYLSFIKDEFRYY